MINYGIKIDAIDGKQIVFPAGNGAIKHVCCDCGLTHEIEVFPNRLSGGFRLVFHRNNRSTGQFRRHAKEQELEKSRQALKEQSEQFMKANPEYYGGGQ